MTVLSNFNYQLNRIKSQKYFCFFLLLVLSSIFLAKLVWAACCVCYNSSGDCQWPNNTVCWGKPDMQPNECTVSACRKWCPGHAGQPMQATFRSQECIYVSECSASTPPPSLTHCCVIDGNCREVLNQSDCKGKIYLNVPCENVGECSKKIIEEKETPVVVPELQIQIPGFKGFSKEIEICLEEGKSLEECSKEKRAYVIPWIGEYIAAIYKWSVGAIAIIAIIMIMIGGFQWLMAGGNVSKISDAKSRMTYAVIGLVLILGSNLVLSSINPNLTIFRPIVIGRIKRMPLEAQGYVDDTQIETNLDCAKEEDLERIDDSPYIYFTSTQSFPKLRKETAQRLKQAAAKLYQTRNTRLQVNNAFRTIQQQIKLCEYSRKKGQGACPTISSGKSCSEVTCNMCPHPLGYAVDVACEYVDGQKSGKGADNDRCGLTAIMKEFGFCRLDPVSSKETWHFEYPKMSSKCGDY